MKREPTVNSFRGERRALRAALAIYCLFIVYGSLIPFEFTADSRILGGHLAALQLYPFQGGRKNFSIPDVVGNVLFFVPFGFLLVGGGLAGLGRRRWWWQLLASGSLGAALAILVEAGQLFSVGRTASLLDVQAETAGTLLGATAACRFFRRDRGRLSLWGMAVVREAPAVVPLGLLALALVADRFYPFDVSLYVSTAWHSLAAGRWMPFRSFGRRFWGDVVVDNVVPFAFLAALSRHVAGRLHPPLAPAATTWLGSVIFAASLEAGTLFFEGRSPNVDNVILAGAGALAGVTLIPWIVRRRSVQSHPGNALFALAIGLLAYAELTPFDFALAPSAIAAKVARIEWLPLASYARADLKSALFDLWNKLLLAGFLGFAAALATSRGARAAGAAGLLLGGILEGLQVLKVTRIPSITDALIFGAGAYLGGAAYARYQLLRRAA